MNGQPETGCGCCLHFLYEDMDGFGYCNIEEREMYCGGDCENFEPEQDNPALLE